MKEKTLFVSAVGLAAAFGALVGSVIPSEREITVNRIIERKIIEARKPGYDDYMKAFQICREEIWNIEACKSVAKEAVAAGQNK